MNLIHMEDDRWAFDDPNIDSSSYELLDDAISFWESNHYDASEAVLKKIVRENSSHIDAYHHLSIIYEETSRDVEAYLCCREAVRIGLSAIPKEFDWRKSKLEWLVLDNRPFLRAYLNLGILHEKRGELDLAIEVLKRIISICPNDNLGVRYILPKLCFEQGDILGVIRLCKEFESDSAPEILYSHPLAMVLSGESKKAEKLFSVAVDALPIVAKELKKKRHTRPKSMMKGHITHGGADQAYEYWKQYGKYWKNSEDAMSLLEGQ